MTNVWRIAQAADNFTGAPVGKRKQYDANDDEMKCGRSRMILRLPEEYVNLVSTLPVSHYHLFVSRFPFRIYEIYSDAGMEEVSDRQATSSQTPTHQEQATLRPRAL